MKKLRCKRILLLEVVSNVGVLAVTNTVEADDFDEFAGIIDLVESMFRGTEYCYKRTAVDEIALVVQSADVEYAITFTWMGKLDVLHLACAFGQEVPEALVPAMLELVCYCNQEMPVGHFEFWEKDRLILYRSALMLPSDERCSSDQIQAMVDFALGSCNSFVPMAKQVVSGGMRAEDIMAAANDDMGPVQGSA